MALNEELVMVKEKARERYRQLKESAGEFSIEELVNHIKGIEPPPQSVMEYMDIKLKDLEDSVQSGYAGHYVLQIPAGKKYLEEFLQSSRGMRNYPVSRVDEDFIQKFYNFLRRERTTARIRPPR